MDTNIDKLYTEVQEDLNLIVGPLFEFGESQVRKRGAFLRFGATLSAAREVGLHAASTGEEISSSVEELPLLHEALRASVREANMLAVAVCEWVKINRDGKQTDGLTIAFYVPCEKKFLKGWQFKPMFAIEAEPEVKAWDLGGAS